MRKLGLALGAGGARGLAHVAILEVLDRVGWRPSVIAGTSIGAILGGLYASGLSAERIAAGVRELAAEKVRDVLPGRRASRWLELVRYQRGRGGLLNAEHFLERLTKEVPARTFEELEIPLKVVAADFWAREEVVLDSGELRPALQASMSLPAVFRPVVQGGRVLIDGGTVNPVPFDLLQNECDVVIAVDVAGRRSRHRGDVPTLTQAVFNTFQIMQSAIVREKMKRPPTLYLEPDLRDIRLLQFYRADEILKQAAPMADHFERELRWLADQSCVAR